MFPRDPSPLNLLFPRVLTPAGCSMRRSSYFASRQDSRLAEPYTPSVYQGFVVKAPKRSSPPLLTLEICFRIYITPFLATSRRTLWSTPFLFTPLRALTPNHKQTAGIYPLLSWKTANGKEVCSLMVGNFLAPMRTA